MQTTLVLADDHPIVRSGIRRILETREDFEVVGEAANGQEVVEVVHEMQPDVALVDIQMPRLSGVDATRCIAKSDPQTRVLVLSVHDSGSCVEEALRAGAAGYLVKTAGLEEILRAVDAIRSGGSYLSPTVASHVLGVLSDPAERTPSPLRALTGRERQVLQLIAEGFSSREIAEQLGVSCKTVDTHRANLMLKLDIHKVSGLVRLAVREGLVKP